MIKMIHCDNVFWQDPIHTLKKSHPGYTYGCLKSWRHQGVSEKVVDTWSWPATWCFLDAIFAQQKNWRLFFFFFSVDMFLAILRSWPFWDGENVTLSRVVGDIQLGDEKVTNWITWLKVVLFFSLDDLNFGFMGFIEIRKSTLNFKGFFFLKLTFFQKIEVFFIHVQQRFVFFSLPTYINYKLNQQSPIACIRVWDLC